MSAPLILIPIRCFVGAKTRLSKRLGEDERASLMIELATGVIEKTQQFDRLILSNDAQVLSWAAEVGVEARPCTSPGLNPALDHGLGIARERSIDHVAIVPADLAAPSELDRTLRTPLIDNQVLIIADHALDGTNLLVVPTLKWQRFAFGTDSFAAHCREARRLGLDPFIVENSLLRFDVDTPADLDDFRARGDSGY